jgi:hypothetical protein
MAKKNLAGLLIIPFLLLSLTFTGVAHGQKDQITQSAFLIATLSQKGLVQVCPGDNIFVRVEPLYWRSLTHIRKQKTVQAMINLARSDNKGQDFVIFQDMTTSEKLATGYIKSGQIDIVK